MSQTAPGRVDSIVHIHNPSIEVHTVDRGLSTGSAVILAAGGGHNTLNVGTEAADFVPFARNRTPPPIPRNAPPAFLCDAGSGDQGHAVWAMNDGSD